MSHRLAWRIAVGLTAIIAIAPARGSAQQQLVKSISSDEPPRIDSAEISDHARDLQASFEIRRRRMLPRFYIGTVDQNHCLIVGRFCEWHPNLKDYTIPDEGRDIIRARNDLLRDLERASALIPGDDWIMGQRIRYMLESHDTSTVTVARACRATKWWCDALLGLALHVRGDFLAADSAYELALDGMPSPLRCHWQNLSPLLDDDLRGTYHKMTCAQREAADARIWWVSDPLYMTPGNERRTEHYSRVLQTMLQQNSVNTYGSTWGGDLAELILRFGWAEKWTQEPSHSMYPDAKPSITGHEREPGYHFFLTQRPPDSLAQIADSIFDIFQFPPREQYSPAYTNGFVRLDAQVARFRRGDSTKIVAAYDVTTDTIFGSHKFAAAVIAMGDEATTPSMTELDSSPTKNVLTVSTPWKEQLIGVELMAKDSTAAARWRAGFAEIPLDSGKISVSDLLFVDGAPSLPGSLEEAIPRAHGGTRFNRKVQVGLFWELYGSTPADSALPVTLTITPVDESLLRRAFRVLRIVPKAMPLNIRWQENGAAGVMSPRSVVLDLSAIPAGKYAVKLEVGASGGTSTTRIIEVK
ncbi:MAG TPA: hypothetical protein VJ852_06685 [Gemmatimonadaceae bacterium]|nr:hypothetical protein [Gemmatimonadaceae bacterium]